MAPGFRIAPVVWKPTKHIPKEQHIKHHKTHGLTILGRFQSRSCLLQQVLQICHRSQQHDRWPLTWPVDSTPRCLWSVCCSQSPIVTRSAALGIDLAKTSLANGDLIKAFIKTRLWIIMMASHDSWLTNKCGWMTAMTVCLAVESVSAILPLMGRLRNQHYLSLDILDSLVSFLPGELCSELQKELNEMSSCLKANEVQVAAPWLKCTDLQVLYTKTSRSNSRMIVRFMLGLGHTRESNISNQHCGIKMH